MTEIGDFERALRECVSEPRFRVDTNPMRPADGHDQIDNNRWQWAQPNISSSHRPLLLREHQVQVLDRSAGRALAEIIENRG